MLVCVLFSLLFSQILFSKQIRVGYFLYSGFQNLEDGEFSGYGYEYLREIQKYNDWQYEFVTEIPEKDSSGNKTGRMIPLSYDRALTMLEKGELDIVGSVRKSPDRERHFLFSRFGAGIAYEMLTADAQKNNINKNMQARIGIRTGSIREREFSQICEAAGYNNITFCYFEYNEDMERALHETGEID
ncbi:MAG: amino acid ABC transporter substrate-binding protein, partial [Ignavibacteria bacterium]|nr:amino acid ABC transporter substrate-binding protein [Ignavibacteria bacterium]